MDMNYVHAAMQLITGGCVFVSWRASCRGDWKLASDFAINAVLVSQIQLWIFYF